MTLCEVRRGRTPARPSVSVMGCWEEGYERGHFGSSYAGLGTYRWLVVLETSARTKAPNRIFTS